MAIMRIGNMAGLCAAHIECHGDLGGREHAKGHQHHDGGAHGTIILKNGQKATRDCIALFA